MLAMSPKGEGVLATGLRLVLQQTVSGRSIRMNPPHRISVQENGSVSCSIFVNHWFRLISALIGGSAGLKAAEEAAEDARRAAEAKAAEEARRTAEGKVAKDARRAAEAKAAEDARRVAEAKAAEEARRVAEAKAAEDARRAAEAKVADEARRVAKTKGAENAPRVAKSKAAERVPSGATTHTGKVREEMSAPPADLRLIKEIVAKPRGAASQKRRAPRMRAR
jgi:hypothetical protein